MSVVGQSNRWLFRENYSVLQRLIKHGGQLYIQPPPTIIRCPTHQLLLPQSSLQAIGINPLAIQIEEPRGQFHPSLIVISILHFLQPNNLDDSVLESVISWGKRGSYILTAQVIVSLLLIPDRGRRRRLPPFL